MKWLKEFWVKLWAEAEAQRPATASQMSAGNLTPRAQRVLLLARKEAERLQLPFIGTEHVLLGLSLLGAGVATNVLNKIGLELEVIQAEVEKLAGGQPAETSGERAHYAPLIKEMLSFASQEAKELNHTYVGTEHLLLALLREPDGGAAQIFKNRNVNTEEVRKEIIKELSPVYIPHVPGKGAESSQSELNPAGSRVVFPSRRRESIDLKLRYDVYCVERGEKMVVYRNAQFKGPKSLFGLLDYPMSDFVELEQRDGQTVYVARSSIVRFCQHGVKPEAEGLE